MDNNYWDKHEADNEDVGEDNNDTLHEHEDGTVHSHEGGDVEHSHEEVVEEAAALDYEVAIYGSDEKMIESAENVLLGLGRNYKVLSSLEEFKAGPWFVLCDPDWDAFSLASQLNEVTPTGIGRSSLTFTSKLFKSSDLPFATGRVVVDYDPDDEDLDHDALVKGNVDNLLDPTTDPK